MGIDSVRSHLHFVKMKLHRGPKQVSQKIANLEPAEIISKSKNVR